jgi:hypothetical protein
MPPSRSFGSYPTARRVDATKKSAATFLSFIFGYDASPNKYHYDDVETFLLSMNDQLLRISHFKSCCSSLGAPEPSFSG